jgi:hypothetical protein
VTVRKKESEERQDGATNAQKVTVKANEFVLVDKDNNVRGAFGMDPNNQPQIILLSENQNPWFGVGVFNNTPAMWMFDKKGRPRVELRLHQDNDGVALSMKDGNGVTRVLVGMFEPDSSHIVLQDAEDRMRAVVSYGPSGITTNGKSIISLLNAQGEESAGLTAVDGHPSQFNVGIVREQNHQETDQDSRPDQSPPFQC